jgi:antibiotic biosynthesis monooxygenase (ABM) superfamily enzyme
MIDEQHRLVPATSVITRVVKPGSEKAFEEWLHGISQEAAKFPGHLSVTIFRPAPGGREYTIVVQFNRNENLQRWLQSDRRRDWIERVHALEEVPEHRTEVTGLEHWFTLPGKPEPSPPPKHKMALLIALAAYPTVLALHVILLPILNRVPYPLGALIASVCLVLLLTYVVMPTVTRVFHGWLYPKAP